MSTQTYVGVLVVITCSVEGCGITFGLSESFVSARKRDHATWYCPNGHQRYWPAKSDIELARDRAERAERQREWAETSRRAAWDQAETAERRRRAAKGQLTKTRKRIANGVCPCCNRTFSDLAAHMTTKHPDYAEPSTGATTA